MALWLQSPFLLSQSAVLRSRAKEEKESRAGMAVERLLSSPRAGGPALPAAFDAVRTLHRMVGAALAGARH